MMDKPNNIKSSCQLTDTVQIEVPVAKLEELFRLGMLCAADLRSLNDVSKRCIWELCLTSCAKKLSCIPSPEICADPQIEAILVQNDHPAGNR